MIRCRLAAGDPFIAYLLYRPDGSIYAVHFDLMPYPPRLPVIIQVFCCGVGGGVEGSAWTLHNRYS